MTSSEGHYKKRRTARSPNAAVAPLPGPRSASEQGEASQDFRTLPENILDDASAAQRHHAADVLTAVADLVSAGTTGAAATGSTFTGLARKLEELEARLHHSGGTDDAVVLKRALGQIETQLQDPPAADTSPADRPRTGGAGEHIPGVIFSREASSDAAPIVARNHEGGGISTPPIGAFLAAGQRGRPAGEASGLKVDVAIRDLTMRMAAVHREALRRGTLGAGGGKRERTATSNAALALGELKEPLAEPGVPAASGPGARSIDLSSRAGLLGLLQQLEAKVDALACKAESAARHQADLLARRIESAELQLTKRLDAGFAATAVETRVVEDMLQALAARTDLGGASLALEGAIHERLERIEEQIASLTATGHALDSGRDLDESERASALATTEDRRMPLGCPDQSSKPAAEDRRQAQEPDSNVRAALVSIQDAIVRIADRLGLIETSLSSARHRPAGTTPCERAPSPVLPWTDAKRKKGSRITRTGRTETIGSFGPHDEKPRRASPEQEAELEVLIEPGSGLVPSLDRQNASESSTRSLDGDEGGNGRTDFIGAACRAARSARILLEPRPDEREQAPPKTHEGLFAKARRLARTFRSSVFSGRAS